MDAFAAGMMDFRKAPVFGLFFGGVYALGGIAIIETFYVFDLSYLSYPIAIGFALIGPFIAVGLYEVSRRLEAGDTLKWRAILGVIYEQRKRELGWMAFVTLFILTIWMYQVRVLLAVILQDVLTPDFGEFLTVLVSTPEGLTFLLVGHIVGAILSLTLFSLTVVSIPLLLERDVDFVTAMITSVKAVSTNPRPMIGWALAVVMMLIVAIVPLFLGLIVVLPVLGHTTWHLYKKVVAPEVAST